MGLGRDNWVTVKVKHFEIEVEEGRGLGSFDMNGKSDPYCAIYCWEDYNFDIECGIAHNYSEKSVQGQAMYVPVGATNIENSTLDPVWRAKNKVQGTNVSKKGFQTAPHNEPVVIEVWDKDLIGGDDFMGWCSLSYEDLKKGMVGQWVKLRKREGAKHKNEGKGEIRVTARFVRKDGSLAISGSKEGAGAKEEEEEEKDDPNYKWEWWAGKWLEIEGKHARKGYTMVPAEFRDELTGLRIKGGPCCKVRE